MDEGMSDSLSKPIEPEELEQMLTKWIPVQHKYNNINPGTHPG